jgi:bacteriocin biosynthesis cyclodehydratase domain-containing protein
MMQPKLNGDTFYIPVPDGVFFRHNQGSFKIQGKVVYRWVESLAPYLNGEYTLEQLTAGLDPQKRAMVTELLNTLLEHGFLKDLSQDLPHSLSPTEQHTYAAEIAFIDSFADSGASRFERFREHRVLLIGSGLTLTGLVHASLKSGLRQITLLTTPECATHLHRHQEYLELFHQGDPRQTLRESQVPDWNNEAEVLSILQPFDTILHVSDRPMLARASLLNRLCVTHHKHLLQAVLVDDHAWVGPLVSPEAQGCWECAWRRLQGNLTDAQEHIYAFEDQPTTLVPLNPVCSGQSNEWRVSGSGVSRFVALPTSALVANRLVFEIFKYVTQAGPVETAGHLVEIDLEQLQTQKHPFSPHPLCSTCQHAEPPTQAQFLEHIQQLEQGEPLNPDLFSKRAAPCFETRLGLFRSLDEASIIQVPLSVCQVVVSNPLPKAANGPAPQADYSRTVLGFGARFATARRHGVERACEIYAASLVDRRKLFSSLRREKGCGPTLTPQDLEKAITPERFLGRLPLHKAREWTWAVDLSTGEARLVPALLTYPVLRDLPPLGARDLGVSAGMSWAEAISRALLNICHYLTITQLESASQPYPQVDLAATALSPEGTRQRYLLAHAVDTVTVYDVTGSLQIPTFATCIQGQTVAYTSHLDVAQALRDGLEQATLRKQLSNAQFPADSLPVVPALPVDLRGDNTCIPTSDAPQEWPERQIWLQQVLQRQGWRALALPLDHDPTLSKALPYVVRVLLARA